MLILVWVFGTSLCFLSACHWWISKGSSITMYVCHNSPVKTDLKTVIVCWNMPSVAYCMLINFSPLILEWYTDCWAAGHWSLWFFRNYCGIIPFIPVEKKILIAVFDEIKNDIFNPHSNCKNLSNSDWFVFIAYARIATCISKLKKKLGISKAINKEHC